MGKFRSKSGCLTCRQRRVKCDEVHPTCGNCSKKSRDCQWETSQPRFRGYQPSPSSSSGTPRTEADADQKMDVDEEAGGRGRRSESTETSITPAGQATTGLQQSTASPFLSQITSPTSTPSSGRVTVPPVFSRALPRHHSVPLSRYDVRLVRHYAEHLGRWLDGTSPARQFTLQMPEQVKNCSILLHAIICFSSRHLRDDGKAEEAHQACLALVIQRLELNTALHDDDLLCAIVILRFFEQLSLPSESGKDSERHLAGTSAILRSSQTRTVDPSAPTLRNAAFWVYVRQCLYNATINQQPPNVDFSLQLQPMPAAMNDSHPLATLRLETAWANQMTWICARVVNYCFDGNTSQERGMRMEQWQTLWDDTHGWKTERPQSFDPLWTSAACENSVFPEIFFTADWHVIAFGFYHFSCILLLLYKPGPRFAIRTLGSGLTDTDHRLLEHIRAICGSCRSSPEVVPCLITLCHTIFIWGPLLTDPKERNEVLEMLIDFEKSQRWPTTWIVNALRAEWRVD